MYVVTNCKRCWATALQQHIFESVFIMAIDCSRRTHSYVGMSGIQ